MYKISYIYILTLLLVPETGDNSLQIINFNQFQIFGL